MVQNIKRLFATEYQVFVMSVPIDVWVFLFSSYGTTAGFPSLIQLFESTIEGKRLNEFSERSKTVLTRRTNRTTNSPTQSHVFKNRFSSAVRRNGTPVAHRRSTAGTHRVSGVM